MCRGGVALASIVGSGNASIDYAIRLKFGSESTRKQIVVPLRMTVKKTTIDRGMVNRS